MTDPARRVYVGDRLFDDVWGAHNAGLRAIHIPHRAIPLEQVGHTEGEPDAVAHPVRHPRMVAAGPDQPDDSARACTEIWPRDPGMRCGTWAERKLGELPTMSQMRISRLLVAAVCQPRPDPAGDRPAPVPGGRRLRARV